MKRLAISYLSHCNTPLGLSICMRYISTGLGSPFRTSAISNRTRTTSKIFYRESGTGAYLSRVWNEILASTDPKGGIGKGRYRGRIVR